MTGKNYGEVPRLDDFDDTEGLNALRLQALEAGATLSQLSGRTDKLSELELQGAHAALLEALGGFAILAGGAPEPKESVIDGFFGVMIGERYTGELVAYKALCEDYGQTTRHLMPGLVIPTSNITAVSAGVFIGPKREREAGVSLRIRRLVDPVQERGSWYKLPLSPDIWTGAYGTLRPPMPGKTSQ